MSGLLQRLAGQATVANTAGTPIRAGRIRPAASVHAPAPVALPADAELEQLPQAFSHAPREAKLAEERSAAWEAHPLAAMPAHAAQTSAFAKSPIASVPRVAGISATQLQESSLALEGRTPQALLGEPPGAASPVPAISPITSPRMAIEIAPHPAANESYRGSCAHRTYRGQRRAGVRDAEKAAGIGPARNPVAGRIPCWPEALVSTALAIAGVTQVLRDLLNDRFVNSERCRADRTKCHREHHAAGQGRATERCRGYAAQSVPAPGDSQYRLAQRGPALA